MTEPSLPLPDPLSLFWSPICAVGSHGPSGPNAQISVSVFGASVVPDRPRLVANLWKDNFTSELVRTSGSLAITVLSASQSHLIAPLGLASGADGQKLDGLEFALTPSGDPFFAGGVALIDCAVIEAHDIGDAWSFLVAVRERRRLSDASPVSRVEMMSLIAADVRDAWTRKITARIPAYREQMVWLDE